MVAASRPECVTGVILSGGYVPPNRAGSARGSSAPAAGSSIAPAWSTGSCVTATCGPGAAMRRPRCAPHCRWWYSWPGWDSVPRPSTGVARSVRCPVLAISGDCDSHVPASWTRGAARRFGWTLAVIRGGGHFSHTEQPGLWVDAVEGWLAGEPPGQRHPFGSQPHPRRMDRRADEHRRRQARARTSEGGADARDRRRWAPLDGRSAVRRGRGALGYPAIRPGDLVRPGTRGLVEVEAGIQWPELVAFLVDAQDADDPERWTIIQKQSGADRFSLGGTISANGHGRGLTLAPIVADIESMSIVDPAGELRTISRGDERELFSLVAGGYGLFGVIARSRSGSHEPGRWSAPSRSVRSMASTRRSPSASATGTSSVTSSSRSTSAPTVSCETASSRCYRPVDPSTTIPSGQRVLSREDWGRLLYLAHADRAAAYRVYTEHYAATTGQLYRSDSLQMAEYERRLPPGNRCCAGRRSPSDGDDQRAVRAPRPAGRLHARRRRRAPRCGGARHLRHRSVDRARHGQLSRRAREPWACVIFNLCTEHTPGGIGRSAAAFRALIDLALARGGSYFPTYHRWATLDQLLAAHPRFPEFVRAKRRVDPGGLFESEWFRHYTGLLDGQ